MATEGTTTGVTTLLAGAPAILRRHPALLVEWLRLVNLWSRCGSPSSRATLFVGAALVAMAIVLPALRSGQAAGWIETLARHWVWVGVASAIYGATTVSHRRRHIEESQSQSWLVATPISPTSLQWSHAFRALLPLVAVLAAVVIFAGLVALSNDDVSIAARIVVATVTGGLFTGGAAGWWRAGRATTQAGVAASRYVPRPRAYGLPKPDATALSQWPVAQVLAWGRPENSRYVLVVALLAVQGGSSVIGGLSVVAMYCVASYLAALASAMMSVSKLAATWLRATPMTFGTFALSLSRRAALHQWIGTALAVVLMWLLGAPFALALQVGALWLGLVASMSGCALIDHYRGRSPALKIAWAIAACAVVAALVQLRAGART